MSVASRTLKDHEHQHLVTAQIHAARMCDYATWLNWMRATYPYALSVRMAVHLGFKIPGRPFYNEMFKQGQRMLKSQAA